MIKIAFFQSNPSSWGSATEVAKIMERQPRVFNHDVTIWPLWNHGGSILKGLWKNVDCRSIYLSFFTWQRPLMAFSLVHGDIYQLYLYPYNRGSQRAVEQLTRQMVIIYCHVTRLGAIFRTRGWILVYAEAGRRKGGERCCKLKPL